MPEPIGSPTDGAIPPVENPSAENVPTGETNILDRDTSGLDREASQAALKATREEAAKHRVEARDAKARIAKYEPILDILDRFDEADVGTWGTLMGDYEADPIHGAGNFRTIANNILGDPNASTEQVEAAEAVLEQTPSSDALTPETVAALMDDKLTARDTRNRQDQAIAAVHAKIGDAGFPQGTVDNFSILWIANNDEAAAGDVDKAIEIYKAKQQGTITTYQEGLRANGGTPTIPNSGGVEANAAPPEIKSMEDANKAAKAFLAGRERG
jgi:hypothetical protein